MLLAAGFGTRLKPQTDTLAKPAIPFLDIPLISYPLYLLDKAGVTETIINTHHLPDTVQTAVSKLEPKLNTKIKFSHESPNILDSGGGIDKVKSELSKPDNFILANADNVMLFDHNQGLLPLINKHKQTNALATLLVCDHPGLGKQFGGIWLDDNKQIIGIGKKQPEHFATIKHYTGYMVLNKKIFNYVPQKQASHIFLDVILPAIENGETINVYEKNIKWFETGDHASFQAAEEYCKVNIDKLSINTWQPIQTISDTIKYFS